jgi:hypothetical protein
MLELPRLCRIGCCCILASTLFIKIHGGKAYALSGHFCWQASIASAFGPHSEGSIAGVGDCRCWQIGRLLSSQIFPLFGEHRCRGFLFVLGM